jgi:hypothetical protein
MHETALERQQLASHLLGHWRALLDSEHERDQHAGWLFSHLAANVMCAAERAAD